jgi:hypothetical protein
LLVTEAAAAPCSNATTISAAPEFMSLEEENQQIGSSFDIKPVKSLIVEGELKAWI